jgi:histidinol-phosphate aminotransferase
MEHKVVVRPFHPDGCRVTVSTHAENDQFLAAAREFAATAG